jgi:hypothetical protein
MVLAQAFSPLSIGSWVVTSSQTVKATKSNDLSVPYLTGLGLLPTSIAL